MNVLILHAHPEPKSFSSALKDIAVEHFSAKGGNVMVKDLYAMEFNPVGGKNDFKAIANNEYFHYMKEQMNAFKTGTFADDLQAEMDALKWADFVLLNFPLWWSSMPAILKGWWDRVLAFGFAYHPREMLYRTGAFRGKKAMCCITTGGSPTAYTAEGEHGDIMSIIHHINHGTLSYTGMDVYPPFFAWRSHLVDNETLELYKNQYKEHLNNLESTPFLYE